MKLYYSYIVIEIMKWYNVCVHKFLLIYIFTIYVILLYIIIYDWSPE